MLEFDVDYYSGIAKVDAVFDAICEADDYQPTHVRMGFQHIDDLLAQKCQPMDGTKKAKAAHIVETPTFVHGFRQDPYRFMTITHHPDHAETCKPFQKRRPDLPVMPGAANDMFTGQLIKVKAWMEEDIRFGSGTANTKKNFDFINLPKEIRDKIYKMCIDNEHPARSRVIISCPTSGSLADMHTVHTVVQSFINLSLVSKTIRSEILDSTSVFPRTVIFLDLNCLVMGDQIDLFRNTPGRKHIANLELHYSEPLRTDLKLDKRMPILDYEIIHALVCITEKCKNLKIITLHYCRRF